MHSPTKAHSAQTEYENPFASQVETDPFLSSTYVEPDLDLTGQSTTRTTAPSPPQNVNPFANPLLSGNIGSASRATPRQETSTASFEYTGEDTLDEPVSTTILRDLRKVSGKIKQVLHPRGDRNVLKDWDLWGPLLLCLAFMLSAKAPSDQSVAIFTGVFVIVWVGAAVVTLNAKLLGGAV
ncbi:hypothetical protein DFQ30_007076 [Apophysomyces sp. BC1015]|nr:hypothetical protein DFQ30_007076 [Apophysomyces sp. BC1015]